MISINLRFVFQVRIKSPDTRGQHSYFGKGARVMRANRVIVRRKCSTDCTAMFSSLQMKTYFMERVPIELDCCALYCRSIITSNRYLVPTPEDLSVKRPTIFSDQGLSQSPNEVDLAFKKSTIYTIATIWTFSMSLLLSPAQKGTATIQSPATHPSVPYLDPTSFCRNWLHGIDDSSYRFPIHIELPGLRSRYFPLERAQTPEKAVNDGTDDIKSTRRQISLRRAPVT
jgi:hypothetical protein